MGEEDHEEAPEEHLRAVKKLLWESIKARVPEQEAPEVRRAIGECEFARNEELFHEAEGVAEMARQAREGSDQGPKGSISGRKGAKEAADLLQSLRRACRSEARYKEVAEPGNREKVLAAYCERLLVPPDPGKGLLSEIEEGKLTAFEVEGARPKLLEALEEERAALYADVDRLRRALDAELEVSGSMALPSRSELKRYAERLRDALVREEEEGQQHRLVGSMLEEGNRLEMKGPFRLRGLVAVSRQGATSRSEDDDDGDNLPGPKSQAE